MYHIQNTVQIVRPVKQAQSASLLHDDFPRHEVSSLRCTHSRGSASPHTWQEHLLWYRGIFGTMTLRKISKYSQATSAGANGKIPLVNKTVWTFRPSFISYTLQLHYARSFRHISRSLNIYPVLSQSDPIFSMCEQGDLLGLQTALTRQCVSPFVTDYESGWTLLHVSTRFSIIMVHDCK